MKEKLMSLAKNIASKSPVVTVGIKKTIDLYKQDGIKNGLEFVKYWNMSQLLTNDIPVAAQALMGKTKPNFPKL